MVDQKTALDRLNMEKEYEDKLARDLLDYFIDCLDDIDGLSEQQRKQLSHQLGIIRHESLHHSYLFNTLIQKVIEHPEHNF